MAKNKKKTIAVVINVCFGGFGLSKEAILELYKMKAPGIKAMTPQDYYGKDWEVCFKRDTDPITAKLYNLVICDGKILIDEYGGAYGEKDALRADPKLVKVVRKMGNKSWGQSAELKIVRIPADVEWGIEDYDGVEHIREKSRTWY